MHHHIGYSALILTDQLLQGIGPFRGIALQAHHGLRMTNILRKNIRETINWQYDVFFVMLGGNDIADQNTNSEIFGTCAKNLIKFIHVVNPRALILMSSVLPRMITLKRSGKTVIHRKVTHFNNALKTVCSDPQVPATFVDLFVEFLKKDGSGDIMDNGMCQDGVHFTKLAKDAIKEFISTVIRFENLHDHFCNTLAPPSACPSHQADRQAE